MTLRDINLVPEEVLYGDQIRRQTLRWSLLLAGCMAVVFCTYWYQSRIVLARMRPSTTLADMHAQLGATLDEISAAQKEIERLSMQQSILKELSVHQSFPDLLEVLAQALNPQTWLTEVEIETGSSKDTQTGMRLKGYAVSNELLANFLTQLSQTPQMENVLLKLAREANLPGLIADSDQLVKVVDFDIRCRLEEVKP